MKKEWEKIIDYTHRRNLDFIATFVNKKDIKKGIKAPLNLVYCKKCELLQLEHSAPQEIMYKKFFKTIKIKIILQSLSC